MRGSARAHRRPGARPPSSRPAGARPARPATPPVEVPPERPAPLEVAPQLAEAAVEQQAVVEHREPVRSAQHRVRAKPGSVLAARAATEYVYVGQDLRRIAIVSTVLVGLMIAAWLLIVVLQIIPLDFY